MRCNCNFSSRNIISSHNNLPFAESYNHLHHYHYIQIHYKIRSFLYLRNHQNHCRHNPLNKEQETQNHKTLDPFGSSVRYEMMKLCTGSVQDTMRRQQLVSDDTGSVEDIHAFINCKKWRSGLCHRCLTHKGKIELLSSL